MDKMTSQLRYIAKATLIFLLWIPTPVAQGKDAYASCPIGFSLVYRKDKDTPLCYRLKGPETFADKYKDCVGNLYTSKLHQELNFSKPEYAIWTEYRSLYPGGLFVDWSYTKTMGDVFETDVYSTLDPTLDSCLVLDPFSNFTAVRCSAKHYRYCVVKQYSYKEGLTKKGCEGLKDSTRFWSPVSTCLTALSGVGGGAIRATWNQAQELCSKKGGSLLNRGWRYSNYKDFANAGTNHTYPFGIIMSTDYSLLRYDAVTDHSEIPPVEWKFETTVNNTDTLLGALHNDFWYLVNGSYIFYDVICESSVQLKKVSMKVTIDIENKITLNVNDSLDKDDIYCFTDSVKYYPVKVKKERVDSSNAFVLKPKENGYYWCTHIDTKNFIAIESNKALFVREKESIVNVYALKIKLNKTYRMDDFDHSYKTLEIKLKEYIYLSTKYESVYGDLNTNTTEELLKQFKNSNPGLDLKDKSVIVNVKLKRLYLDKRSMLIHVELYPDIKPVKPGVWEDVEIISMKPVFYCHGFDTINTMSLGESTTTAGCRTHTCVGDFNEGVQWVTTATTACIPRPPTAISRNIQVAEETVTMFMPTVMPQTTNDEFPILHGLGNNTSDEIADTTTQTYVSSFDDRKKTSSTTTPTIIDVPEISTLIFPSEVVTVTSPTTEAMQSSSEEVITIDNTTTYPVWNTTFVWTTTPVATTRPPEQQLEEVMNDLDRLVNATTPIMVEDIGEVFSQVDNIFEVHDSVEIPGRLLHLLDNLGSRVQLNGSRNALTVRNNIALLMADADPDNPVRGMKIATRESDVFTDDAFNIFSDEINSTILNSDKNEVVVLLPQSVSDSSRRISFVVFRNDRAFQPSEGAYAVNSRVLSIKVEQVTTFSDGEVIDIHLNPIIMDPSRNMSRTCAYWKFLEDGTGYWSSDGCTLIPASEPGMLDTCRCTHLTHFAEVLFPKAVFSERNENVLEMLTIVGCCLSMFGLAMVAITALLFRSWRRDYSNKIWLQLCISIFILVFSFLIIIFVKFDQYNIGCMLLGVMLHYAVLSSFCWMLVAAVLSYRRLVLVFTRDASHKLLRASAFSWGVPCAIIGILLSVSPHSYAGRFEEKTPSGSFCYPSGLSMWLTVYAPIAAILLANWTLFVLIVRSVFASRGIQRHGDSNEALRCATVSCLLVFLFGLPWIFGLFAFNVVAAYLFTLTATYQGFMLFFFFVLGNKKTRDLWLNKLKIKQTRKVPVTSSTYTNRSTNWRPTTQPSTVDARASKPRSLNQDDSRFS